MTTAAPPLTIDSGLVCLARLARLHEIAFDPARLVHEFGHRENVFDTTDLLRAARWLGLKAHRLERAPARLHSLPVPFIARCKDAAFVLVAGIGPAGILLQSAGSNRPEVVTAEAFAADYAGEVLLVARGGAAASAALGFGFAWFVPFILKYRRLLGEVLIASLFLQLLALMTPLIFQVVIDKVLVNHGVTTLNVLAIALLGVALFEALLGGLRTYVFTHTTQRIDVALGAELVRHLLRLPLGWFEARRVGDTVNRVRELDTIRQFITGSALTLLVDSIFTLAFFAVMLTYSSRLTAIVAATLPAYALLAVTLTPALRARLQQTFSLAADNHAYLVETVSGMAALKAAAVEPAAARRWEERLAAYVTASFHTAQLSNLANQCAGLINKLMILGILWLGAHEVMRGTLSVGALVAFNMLAARIAGPILRLTQLWQDFQQAGVSLGRLGDILNAPPEPTSAIGARALRRITGQIRFEGVSFRYRAAGAAVIAELNLEIAPGEIVGIVGPSGSGKSTLARLLQRFYLPEAGRVLIDGVDTAMLDSAWLRSNIGVVLQESVLFNCTVADNIALADPGMPFARIVDAARAAGAHAFITALPQGYDTVVGEQGCVLSGGQRQRIAIARALVSRPRILILDEATSALDFESEMVLRANLPRICRGRTVIIVAHRVSALASATRIVVLDAGRIVEQGAPAALRRRGGYYAELCRYQAAAAAGIAPAAARGCGDGA